MITYTHEEIETQLSLAYSGYIASSTFYSLAPKYVTQLLKENKQLRKTLLFIQLLDGDPIGCVQEIRALAREALRGS